MNPKVENVVNCVTIIVVIIVIVIFFDLTPLINVVLCNHTFQTNPNSTTNIFFNFTNYIFASMRFVFFYIHFFQVPMKELNLVLILLVKHIQKYQLKWQVLKKPGKLNLTVKINIKFPYTNSPAPKLHFC